MNYEIVELKDTTVVGKSIITTNENMQCAQDIEEMWQHFIGEGVFDAINHKTTGMGIGLYTDYEGDATKPYRFMCCVEVTKSGDPDLETMTILGGKYAKFIVHGDMVHSVRAAWQEIWQMDIDRKYSYDFELYHNDTEDINNQTIDIYISLN